MQPRPRPDFRERLASALDQIEACGIRRRAAAPPIQRALWALGLRLPPPHMAPPLVNFAVGLLAFTPIFGLMMALLALAGLARGVTLANVVFAGIFVSTLSTICFACSARRRGVPKWSDV